MFAALLSVVLTIVLLVSPPTVKPARPAANPAPAAATTPSVPALAARPCAGGAYVLTLTDAESVISCESPAAGQVERTRHEFRFIGPRDSTTTSCEATAS